MQVSVPLAVGLVLGLAVAVPVVVRVLVRVGVPEAAQSNALGGAKHPPRPSGSIGHNGRASEAEGGP